MKLLYEHYGFWILLACLLGLACVTNNFEAGSVQVGPGSFWPESKPAVTAAPASQPTNTFDSWAESYLNSIIREHGK